LGAFIFVPVITSNVLYYDIKTAALAAGWDGNSIIYATVTVAANAYVYSNNTALPALTTGSGYPDNSRVEIINNGYIIGKGGTGASATGFGSANDGLPGGPAMSIGYTTTITNNSFIAGGGGGGGTFINTFGSSNIPGGGGGAGGGAGGTGMSVTTPRAGGAGGAPGQSGGNGVNDFAGGGGGGGRILPGARQSGASTGGQAGGAGAGVSPGYGGGGNEPGGNGAQTNNYPAGGGGGWGARGGFDAWGGVRRRIPGAGGKAINLNGNTVTFTTTGTVWGAIS
jgi:hypothetical protein